MVPSDPITVKSLKTKSHLVLNFLVVGLILDTTKKVGTTDPCSYQKNKTKHHYLDTSAINVPTKLSTTKLLRGFFVFLLGNSCKSLCSICLEAYFLFSEFYLTRRLEEFNVRNTILFGTF